MPCAPLVPSTKARYTVSFVEVLLVVVTLVAVVAVALLPVQLPELPVTLPVTLPLSAAVIVPALKLPLPSRNTIVLALLLLVAFDVTVNVPPSLLTLPLIPLPLVAPAAT